MKLLICIILIIKTMRFSFALTITTGHCYRNVTVKYQVPITKTRLKLNTQLIEYYVEYEDHIRIDSIRMCCNGYRTIIFGLCEPICTESCPVNSYCSDPEKCVCMNGYEKFRNHQARSTTSKQPSQLQCRPVCSGGCPSHSQCVGHNKCACRAGYKDTSSWFGSLRCERIHCPVDDVYDVLQHKCVRVDMNLEEMMQRVGLKLTNGFNRLDYEEESDEYYNSSQLIVSEED